MIGGRWLVLALVLSACGGGTEVDGGSACAPGEHECPCATGSYCLAGPAMCLDPGAACPGSDAGASDGGSSDGGAVDAGAIDGGAVDAGTADAGANDGGTQDAGTDAGSPTDGGNDAGSDAGTPMCPGTQHVCLCATGYYCLGIGAMCLNPSAPCP